MTDTETAELYNLISQLSANKRKLEARIVELEARECRLLTEEEIISVRCTWYTDNDLTEALQRKAFKVNGLKVKS